MTFHRDPPHYLKPLTRTVTPRRLMWLDCAAAMTREQGMSVARYHVAALGTTHYTRRKQERKDTLNVYGNPYALWHEANQFCGKGKRVVLFAYDLAQQIRTSQAMTHLPMFGWQLENIVLERTAAWALYRSGDRSLMMCDLKSWTTADLSTLVSDVTYGAVTNIEAPAGQQFWPDICRQRAGFVRDITLQILNWIEGEGLGPFRPTGSGQSYAAYRRRFAHTRLLVHDDVARLSAERDAMHTGRCEAWRHGTLGNGPFVEHDMRAAYCTIGRDCEVPAIAQGHVRPSSVAGVERAMTRYAVLANITVQTEVPVLPVKIGNRTVWPVGEFTTWVWDPEIRLALEHCDTVKVNHAYKYLRAPALREFAEYVLSGMGEQTQVYGLVPKRVLKHWSRCLVGRLGLRYRAWEKFLSGAESNLQLVTVIDDEQGTTTDLLWAGTDWLMLTDMGEALDSLPQIPSWVMSECRRRLWDAMLAIGPDLVYVDTDSIIGRKGNLLGDWAGTLNGLGGDLWHIKGTYNRMTIHGPRNYSTESERRVSGVPLKARQTAPLEFTGEVMRSVKESMRAGQLDCVASIPRVFRMDAPDLRRKHLPDGRTEPYRVSPTQPQED